MYTDYGNTFNNLNLNIFINQINDIPLFSNITYYYFTYIY